MKLQIETSILFKVDEAPGLDLMTAEMLKADISFAVEVLSPLIKKIWMSEKLPDDCNKGSVPKKGSLSQCSNWRGITLLSVPSKVFGKIILDTIWQRAGRLPPESFVCRLDPHFAYYLVLESESQ